MNVIDTESEVLYAEKANMLEAKACTKVKQEEFQLSSMIPLPTPDIGHFAENSGTIALMGTLNAIPEATGKSGSGPMIRPNGSGMVKRGDA
jgi:hypothetical protein